MSDVTPIRPPEPPDPNAERESAREELELAALLMAQAVRASILLIDEDDQPHLAADVLRLARDRFESAWERAA